jgi:hypothetical protein
MGDFGVPTDAQLAKINKLAKRKLSAEELFVYPHKMAGDMIIPERYIQLTVPLLKVFADDANAGVAFLLNHSWTWASPKPALPYGRIFEGELSKEGLVEGETISFNGTAYFVRGQEKDGISTDAIISDIETGVLFDTSIGWGADNFECSICGNDIRDWRKCEHIPGKKYIIDEDTGEVKLCWAMAKPPGYLMEDSGVFDGAYPGAGTSLAMLAADGGFENEQGTFVVVDDFKQMPMTTILGTYSSRGGILTFVKKAEYKKVYAMSSADNQPLKGGDTKMDKKVLEMLEALGVAYKEGETTTQEVLDKLAEAWAAIPPAEPQEGEIEHYMTQEQVAEKLGKEYTAEEVLGLAKDGIDFANQKAEYDIYRQETINNALEAGVRAMGNDFPKDTWEATFATMGKKQIEDIAKTWQKQAEDTIPAGRHTDPKAGQAQKVVQSIPNKAYKTK